MYGGRELSRRQESVMRKKIEELVPGDRLELEAPDGIGRVTQVSKRDLLPKIFQHYAGGNALTVDLVHESTGEKLAVQYHRLDVVEVL